MPLAAEPPKRLPPLRHPEGRITHARPPICTNEPENRFPPGQHRPTSQCFCTNEPKPRFSPACRLPITDLHERTREPRPARAAPAGVPPFLHERTRAPVLPGVPPADHRAAQTNPRAASRPGSTGQRPVVFLHERTRAAHGRLPAPSLRPPAAPAGPSACWPPAAGRPGSWSPAGTGSCDPAGPSSGPCSRRSGRLAAPAAGTGSGAG